MLAVLFIGRAVNARNVALFKPDGDEDVSGGGDGENQMADRHVRRRPEGDDETEHDRVAHKLVEKRRPESWLRIFLSAPVEIDLPQAEEIGMIDESRADQHRRPAQQEERPQEITPDGIPHVPHDLRHRSPLPEEQNQCQTRQQDVSASLNRLRNNSRPPTLESGTRHHAVLNGEEAEQQGVNQKRLTERLVRAGVYSFRHAEVSDEPDGVEKRDEENQIADQPVDESKHTTHELFLLSHLVIYFHSEVTWHNIISFGSCRINYKLKDKI